MKDIWIENGIVTLNKFKKDYKQKLNNESLILINDLLENLVQWRSLKISMESLQTSLNNILILYRTKLLNRKKEKETSDINRSLDILDALKNKLIDMKIIKQTESKKNKFIDSLYEDRIVYPHKIDDTDNYEEEADVDDDLDFFDKDLDDTDEDIDENEGGEAFYLFIEDEQQIVLKVYKEETEGRWMIRVAYGNAPELESMSFDNEYDKDEVIDYLKEIYDDIEEITKKEFTQYLGDSEFDNEVEEFEDKREFYPDLEDTEDEE